MAEPVIVCPQCAHAIPVTQALSRQIRGELEKEVGRTLRAREEALERRAKELDDAEKLVGDRVEAALRTEREKIRSEVREKESEAVRLQMDALAEELGEKRKKLEEAQRAELDLRRRTREVEERESALALEVERKLDAERKRVSDEVLKRSQEEHRLKEAESQRQMDSLRKQIDDLKRRAEQGSQQLQGEVLELEIEDVLRTACPWDRIEPVPKGVRGADLLHSVIDASGKLAGTIVWESKRTKAWSDGWLEKIKEDQRALCAEHAIIVSQVLPKTLCSSSEGGLRGSSSEGGLRGSSSEGGLRASFGRVEGVWVTNIACTPGLAIALRLGILAAGAARTAAEGRSEKMEVLYDYLTGHEFHQRVEGIVEAFQSMREDLESEKAAMARLWKKREKEISRVLSSTSVMVGDLQGILGQALPRIESLELGANRLELATKRRSLPETLDGIFS